MHLLKTKQSNLYDRSQSVQEWKFEVALRATAKNQIITTNSDARLSTRNANEFERELSSQDRVILKSVLSLSACAKVTNGVPKVLVQSFRHTFCSLTCICVESDRARAFFIIIIYFFPRFFNYILQPFALPSHPPPTYRCDGLREIINVGLMKCPKRVQREFVAHHR